MPDDQAIGNWSVPELMHKPVSALLFPFNAQPSITLRAFLAEPNQALALPCGF